MYEDALDCGMDSATFWSSSILEITDYMESYRRNLERKKKENVLDLFLLATLIAEKGPFTEKKDLSMPWDFYPHLFEQEKEQFVTETKAAEFENYKAKRAEQIRAFNARRKAGGEEVKQNENTGDNTGCD